MAVVTPFTLGERVITTREGSLRLDVKRSRGVVVEAQEGFVRVRRGLKGGIWFLASWWQPEPIAGSGKTKS